MDKIFKAMADKNRRKVITLLKDRELSVNELLKDFDISQATLSNHLAILRRANLVNFRVLGKQRIYSLNTVTFLSYVEELNKFSGFNDKELYNDIDYRLSMR
jgi:ArsR family transcriptional regulator, arsenate/arsenite/antimonite-responsive transcriptional repressor